MPPVRSLLTLLAALALLAGCAGSPFETDEPAATTTGQPREYLDEQSGATVTAVDRPLIFARDRSERAANLRDYVTLVAAAVNRGGAREYVLIAYVWSTLDPRYEPANPDADALVLVADDRRIPLRTNGKTAADLGIVHGVGAPPGWAVPPLVFPSDLATMRFLAAARDLQLQTKLDDVAVIYVLWDDQRRSLDRLVRFLGGER